MSVSLGRHLLVELYECDHDLLNDQNFLLESCVRAAEEMGATVIGRHSHRFEPIGVSVVLILAESHLSLHSWPEHNVACLDIFTCGSTVNPHVAKSCLGEYLQAGRLIELEAERGRLENAGTPRWRELGLAGAREG